VRENFIYVFSEDARERLLQMQYQLLKRDERNHVYVFVNKTNQNFECDGVDFILSNTLTF